MAVNFVLLRNHLLPSSHIALNRTSLTWMVGWTLVRLEARPPRHPKAGTPPTVLLQDVLKILEVSSYFLFCLERYRSLS